MMMATIDVTSVLLLLLFLLYACNGETTTTTTATTTTSPSLSSTTTTPTIKAPTLDAVENVGNNFTSPINETPSAEAHQHLPINICETMNPCQNGAACKWIEPSGESASSSSPSTPISESLQPLQPHYQCLCNDYFTGNSCESLNLKLPAYDVSDTGITFFWPSSFTLLNFSVLTLEKSDDASLKIEPLWNFTDQSVLEVHGLKPDGVQYVICVLSDDQLRNKTDAEIEEEYIDISSGHCGTVVTAYDGLGPYTLAAFGVAAAMAAVLLALAVCRGGANCSQRLERETMMATVMGTLHKLRGGQSFKNKAQEEEERPQGDIEISGGHTNGAFAGDMTTAN